MSWQGNGEMLHKEVYNERTSPRKEHKHITKLPSVDTVAMCGGIELRSAGHTAPQ